MNKMDYHKMIDDFEQHYQYDSTYMRELLDSSSEGFTRFNNFMPLNDFREKLDLEDYWVAKLAAMQIEDCGECLQLNVRMALEAGVAKGLVEAAIHDPSALPVALQDVFCYAKHVACDDALEPDQVERIMTRYDKGSLLELGLCVATAKVFPTVKRAVGYTKSCSLISIDVEENGQWNVG